MQPLADRRCVMADKPILFSAPMVRALLDGTKTQTRRILKPQPPEGFDRMLGYVGVSCTKVVFADTDEATFEAAIRISVGDRIWVKETHSIVPRTAYRMSEGVPQMLRPNDNHDAAVYREGWERSQPGRWRPSIHMPRWASRLTLIVTDVRVERLQDISEEDAAAEGWPAPENRARTGIAEIRDAYPIGWYAALWDTINGPGAWEADPWVVAYTFTVMRGNIDQIGGA